MKNKKYTDEFENSYKKLSSIVKSISDYTAQIINMDTPATNKIFPINIYRVAKKLGIEVEECDLSRIPQLPTNRVFGILKKDGHKFLIQIEKNADSFTKRYAIAHEIGHFLIVNENQSNDSISSNDTINGIYSMPLLSSKSTEYLADIYAIFLLVPLQNFFVEFSDFVLYSVDKSDANFSINLDDWFRELSIKAQIPSHNFKLSYEYIRMAAYEHYLEIKNEPMKTQFEKFAYLFV